VPSVTTAFADTDAEANNASASRRPGSNQVAGSRLGAFRVRLITAAFFLLTINLSLGLFARQQQHAVVDYAVNIYDTAFISTNYVHLAQRSFQHYIDERRHTAGPAEMSKANELLDKVLDEVDVAIERSNFPLARAQGLEIRTNIAALRDAGMNEAELANRLTDIQQKMEQLGVRNAAVGLRARDDVEDIFFKSDFLLLGSIFTSIILAGLALWLLHRMINSLERSSAQLSAALEGMPQGLCMFDRDRRLIVCNSNYAFMYRLRGEDTCRAPRFEPFWSVRSRRGSVPSTLMALLKKNWRRYSDQLLAPRSINFKMGELFR